MEDKDKIQAQAPEQENVPEQEQYSLNDDRRVKVLSPGQLVVRRFIRNKTAIAGLIILVFMFVFSFIGGLITPYKEDQLFYKTDYLNKEYAAAIQNTEFRYSAKDSKAFSSIIQAQFVLASQKKASEFSYKDIDYTVETAGEDFYVISLKGGDVIGIAFKDIFSPSSEDFKPDFDFQYEVHKAYVNGSGSFSSGGKNYTITEDGLVMSGDEETGFISQFIVSPFYPDVFLTRQFKEELIGELEKGAEVFTFTDADGTTAEYTVRYNPASKQYSIMQATATRVYDTYAYPSKDHWLGLDGNGMDMLTRLMYGGRISLVIGFIVEIIATVLGSIFGGLAGYYGGWVDNLIMRIVDVFYCIPSMPIIIIIGAAMDSIGVAPMRRLVYLMLILGFLGWPGMARLIRGQILSLREQEFMTATEASGLSVKRRIMKHLIPNVIPQIIVSVSMGVGGTIIMESTLSFLGLGVKFPFASWGNIIHDVNNLHVLTTYWFIWIPAGVLLLLTVLAFNLVGDGLRDAFDPKMKR
ncbi:MAG: ABC transporter permease [Firmicutes bacterium]|nr:ABC transporter permease [Bacillota bacterium]